MVSFRQFSEAGPGQANAQYAFGLGIDQNQAALLIADHHAVAHAVEDGLQDAGLLLQFALGLLQLVVDRLEHAVGAPLLQQEIGAASQQDRAGADDGPQPALLKLALAQFRALPLVALGEFVDLVLFALDLVALRHFQHLRPDPLLLGLGGHLRRLNGQLVGATIVAHGCCDLGDALIAFAQIDR